MMAAARTIAHTWGATPAERARPFPCDCFLRDADAACFRAVEVRAPAALAFRWLCQLRVAPYSYDWIDNPGRHSPRRLTRGLDDLARGQRVMTIFTLAAFERERHLTLTVAAPRALALFGQVAVTYAVVPLAEDRCRLLVKLLVRYPARGPGRLLRRFFPWGDLLMMRKQLLTLRDLAERQWARANAAFARGGSLVEA